jgi:hypothetical protein
MRLVIRIASIAVLAAMVMLVACEHDCIDCGGLPPSVVGNYTGIYSYTRVQAGIDTVVDTTQLIDFVFRQNEFSMSMNAGIPNSLRVFCDVVGTYELGNGAELNITDSNFTRNVCPRDWGPSGYFKLEQTSDTVHLSNQGADTSGVWHKRYLRLVNVD